MALNNIKAEMRRDGITNREMAEKMSISENTLSRKLNETTSMTLDEIRFIRDTWFPDLQLDYLCKSS